MSLGGRESSSKQDHAYVEVDIADQIAAMVLLLPDLFTSLLECVTVVFSVFYLSYASRPFTNLVPFEDMKAVAPGTIGPYRRVLVV